MLGAGECQALYSWCHRIRRGSDSSTLRPCGLRALPGAKSRRGLQSSTKRLHTSTPAWSAVRQSIKTDWRIHIFENPRQPHPGKIQEKNKENVQLKSAPYKQRRPTITEVHKN